MQDPQERMRALELENVRLRALRDYPDADPEILAMIADPDAVATAAMRSQDAVRRGQDAVRQGQGQPQPPAGSPEPQDQYDRERRVVVMKLRNNSLKKTLSVDDVLPYSGTRQEMGDLFVTGFNNHMAHRKRGYGDLDRQPTRRGGL